VKRNWWLIGFLIAHALILLVLFRSGIYHNGSLQHDVSLFFDYASKIAGGSLPYQDFTVEYPPAALIFFVLPRLAASTLSAYQLAFAVEILIFDILCLFLLYKISQHLKIRPLTTLTIYTVLLLGIGPIIIYRYDLIPATMVLASLYFFSQQKYLPAWAILAAATMTKIYPAIIAPLFLIYLITQHHYREIRRGIGTFALTLVILILPGLLIEPAGFWNSFNLQMQRGLHAETTYAALLLLGQTLGLNHVSIQVSGPTPLSINAVSELANTLAKIALPLMVLALGLIYWIYYRRRRAALSAPTESQEDLSNLIPFSFLAILVFMLTNNVFSPQYLIWLLPFVCVIVRPRHIPWIAFAGVTILTYYLYPMHYNSFMREDPTMIYILCARNLLLIGLAVFMLVWKPRVKALKVRQTPGFSLTAYPSALLVIVALSSILFTQLATNLNILPSELDNAIPGNRFPGGRPGGMQNDFPGGTRPERNQPGNLPNDGGNFIRPDSGVGFIPPSQP
jgi:uncharacterized membrane protein